MTIIVMLEFIQSLRPIIFHTMVLINGALLYIRTQRLVIHSDKL